MLNYNKTLRKVSRGSTSSPKQELCAQAQQRFCAAGSMFILWLLETDTDEAGNCRVSTVHSILLLGNIMVPFQDGELITLSTVN